MFLIFVPPTCFDCNNDEYRKVLIMNEYVTKSKKLYPKTPLSIFMVRLILCDCSLCQHGFDIQINQNILEKLIISRSAHQTPNFTNPEFQFPQFQVLQSGFSLYYMSSIGIFGCIFIST